MAYTRRRRTTPNANKKNYDSSGKRTFTSTPTKTTTTSTPTKTTTTRRPKTTASNTYDYDPGLIYDPARNKRDLTKTSVRTPAEGYTPIGDHMDASADIEGKQILAYYGDMWNKATTQEEKNRWHNLAEEFRMKNYGYLGGVDGSQQIPIGTGGEHVASEVTPEEMTYLKTPEARDWMYGFTPDKAAAKLESVQGLVDKYMEGLNIDEEAILGKFQDATRAEYQTKGEELRGAESRFADMLGQTGFEAADAIRRANAAAVATGASRGAQAAQELSAMLGLQEQGTEAATELGQARALLGTQEAEALAKDVTEAATYADAAKMGVGGLARDIYTADTQFGVGQMDYVAALESQLQNMRGMLAEAGIISETDIYEADQQLAGDQLRLEGQKYSADKSYQSYTDSAKINAAARNIASGTATTQEKEDYLSILNSYVADGSPTAKAAYITAITRGNTSDEALKYAEESWNAAVKAGKVDTITSAEPFPRGGISERGADWIAPYDEFYKDPANRGSRIQWPEEGSELDIRLRGAK